jgi:protein CpxP
MRKLLLLCCLFIGLAAASNAQTKPGPKPVEKSKDLQKQLKLNDKQTGEIAAIYQESSDKFDKIKATDKGDNTKMLVDIKPLRAATITKIKAVLTKEQALKYDKLLKGNKAAGGSGWGDGWSATSGQ